MITSYHFVSSKHPLYWSPRVRKVCISNMWNNNLGKFSDTKNKSWCTLYITSIIISQQNKWKTLVSVYEQIMKCIHYKYMNFQGTAGWTMCIKCENQSWTSRKYVVVCRYIIFNDFSSHRLNCGNETMPIRLSSGSSCL